MEAGALDNGTDFCLWARRPGVAGPGAHSAPATWVLGPPLTLSQACCPRPKAALDSGLREAEACTRFLATPYSPGTCPG